MKPPPKPLPPEARAVIVEALARAVVAELDAQDKAQAAAAAAPPPAPASPPRLLYRPAEAATLLGISRARAYELIAQGAIPSIRLGTSIRVPADALAAWIAAQTSPQRGG